MEAREVTIFVNLSDDGEGPAWLRVGSGRLRPDGFLSAVFLPLFAGGRIHIEPVSPPGARPIFRPHEAVPAAPLPGRSLPPPPPPARRRGRGNDQEALRC
jgi:hypothetical protein